MSGIAGVKFSKRPDTRSHDDHHPKCMIGEDFIDFLAMATVVYICFLVLR